MRNSKALLLLIVGSLAFTACSKPPKKVKDPNAFTLIRSDFTPGEIDDICDEAIDKFEESLKKAETVYDLDWAITEFNDAVDPAGFMKYVSTDKKLREAGGECEERQSKIMVEVFTQKELYQKLRMTQAKKESDKYFIEEMLNKFRANGMALNDKDLKKFKKVKKELAELEAKFSKNLNEDTTRVYYTEAELAGVPAGFLSTKTPKKGKYEFTTKYTDFGQIMRNASNPESRKRMLLAYDNRAGKENSKLLKEAVALRAEAAKILGFKNWADYRTSQKMAGSSEKALTLLNDLAKKLKPRLKKDMARFEKAKKKMEGKDAGPITAWDIRYYINQVKKQDYSLDDEVLREYFPKDYTMEGMFDIYETLFGVKFEEIKNADVWHPQVKMYRTLDKKTKKVLSYFYMDLFPRDGKYGHAAAFTLQRGKTLADGTYSKPVSSVVANFTAPTDTKPSLLTFREVETLFHEFGHIVHQTLTKAPYGTAAGTAVKRDFVEAPSQMLENWIWNRTMLKKFSGHYKNTKKKIPAKLARKLIASKDYNLGYFYSRQIVLGKTDLAIHTSDNVEDVNKVYRDMHNEILGFPTVDGSQWMAGFGHMMGGYDAGYYGYIWSEVYAADMFTKFKANGYLNRTTGGKYRRHILETGGMEDPFKLISKFLGRKPNNRAFLRKLGI